MNGRHSSIVLVVPILLVLARCSALPDPAPESREGGSAVPATADPSIAPFLVGVDPDTARRVGVAIRVSDAEPASPQPAGESAPAPLDSAAALFLLDRLVGPKPSAPQLAAPFRFATTSMPAPRPGTTIVGVFPGVGATRPAIAAPAAPSRDPLRVIRTAPRNEI